MKRKTGLRWKVNWPGALVLACGLALITAGVMRGEADVVFRKAVTICLECIGIG